MCHSFILKSQPTLARKNGIVFVVMYKPFLLFCGWFSKEAPLCQVVNKDQEGLRESLDLNWNHGRRTRAHPRERLDLDLNAVA